MRARDLLLCLLVAAFLAGCRGTSQRAVPGTALEKGIYFEERDERGHPYDLSARAPKSKHSAPAAAEPSVDTTPAHEPVRSLASGTPIDLNSTLAIDVLKGELMPRGGGTRELAAPEALVDRTRAIGEVLASHADVVEARAEALRAWSLLETETDASEAFVARRQAFARAERENIDRLDKIWPETHPDREKIEDVYDVTPERAATFSRLLQEQIDELDEAIRALAAAAEERATRLRIEAFLHPGREHKDPLPIHVPGYDDLDQKQLVRIDPYGLALTESERESLEALSRASKEIAEALERVRKGEATLEEAFRDATSEVSRKIGAYLASIESLRTDLATKALEARLADTRAALDGFLAELAAIVQSSVDEVRSLVTSEIDARSEDLDGAPDPVGLLAKIEKLIADWKALTPQSLPDLLARSLSAFREIGQLLEGLGAKGQGLEALAASIEARFGELPATVRERAQTAWSQSGLKGQLQGWSELAGRARNALAPVKNLLSVAHLPAVSTSITTPGAIELPVDQATNTTIEVMRTPRLPGDSIEVRATLLEGGKAKETKSQFFPLEKLGWHADIAPSVVFVTADQLAQADDTGGFSPALAWIWRYGPREGEDDFLARSSRALEWGVGLHATFLNFDDDHDAAVGLGVSTSLWEDILIFGAGVNLFADDDRDGRYYYFVGSSLIALLQKLRPGED